jgi:ABC-type Co2+ transport system permease subunit
MHIEPGVVDGAKILLSVGTASVACALTVKAIIDTLRSDGVSALIKRTLMTTFLVFLSFEVLWHHPVGVSEVHLIMGSTLFLLFGAAPTALGLTFGLLIQGIFFAPTDLPQFGMNLTSLLLPLFVMSLVARQIIKPSTAYVDLSYRQTLKLSLVFQGGVVAWVAFWTLYGQGLYATNWEGLASFAAAYSAVILIEPLLDLCVLAMAKHMNSKSMYALFTPRLTSARAS